MYFKHSHYVFVYIFTSYLIWPAACCMNYSWSFTPYLYDCTNEMEITKLFSLFFLPPLVSSIIA